MDMNEAQHKALERGLNDATALSQDEWRGVALAMMAQCQPWYEELERLRAAGAALEKRLVDRIAEGDRYYDEDEYANGAYSGEFEMAETMLKYGRELGLFT